jgi:hypothetical protein
MIHRNRTEASFFVVEVISTALRSTTLEGAPQLHLGRHKLLELAQLYKLLHLSSALHQPKIQAAQRTAPDSGGSMTEISHLIESKSCE